MNADQLADHLVGHFNNIADPIIESQATKPDALPEHEAERDDFQVFVIPFSESETRINRADTCDQRRMVSVVVAGPIHGMMTRTIALSFVDQLKRSLRRTAFEGHRWMNNDTVTYWHPDALKAGQFYSVFRAEYIGLG